MIEPRCEQEFSHLPHLCWLCTLIDFAQSWDLEDIPQGRQPVTQGPEEVIQGKPSLILNEETHMLEIRDGDVEKILQLFGNAQVVDHLDSLPAEFPI